MKHPPAKTVIVIGEKNDAHTPFVECHLSAPLVEISADTLISGEELSYSLYKGKLHITYMGRPLNNAVRVWYRGRRAPAGLSVPVASTYQEYAKTALLRHTKALFAPLEKVRWVSNPFAILRAEYKPLQLQAAASLGFKIPDTLFTSSPARAKEFIDSHSAVITKPLGSITPLSVEKNLGRMFFTTKIHKGEEIDLSGLRLAPAIFQQAIDAAADLRVTVIGDKIFPAIITDKKLDPSSQTRDWRAASITGYMDIQPYKLPKDIANKCIALVKELGLEFGAIDLVLDKKKEIWFLEINPNGQWAFVEEATGQPMGKALADLLQG